MRPNKKIQKGVQARVFNFVQDHPGMHINAARVAEELPEYTHKQASNGLYQLYKKGLLEKPSDGVYFYRGTGVTPTAPTGRFDAPKPINQPGRHMDPGTVQQNGASHLYENIGQLQDGSAVVKSDEGELFVLETIEEHITSKILLEQ